VGLLDALKVESVLCVGPTPVSDGFYDFAIKTVFLTNKLFNFIAVMIVIILLNIANVGLIIISKIVSLVWYSCGHCCSPLVSSPLPAVDNDVIANNAQYHLFMGKIAPVNDDDREISIVLDDNVGTSNVISSTTSTMNFPSRNDVNSIKEYIKLCLRSKRSKYCYLRCLLEVDQETFIDKMAELLNANCPHSDMQELIDSGTMEMRVWKEIMETITLENTYNLYRSAFWGERTDSVFESDVITAYHVLLCQFPAKNKQKASIRAILWTRGHLQHYFFPLFLKPIQNSGRETVNSAVWNDIVKDSE